jgi:hypothetical protein
MNDIEEFKYLTVYHFSLGIGVEELSINTRIGIYTLLESGIIIIIYLW